MKSMTFNGLLKWLILKWTSQNPISQSYWRYNPEPKPTWPNLANVKSNDLFNSPNPIFVESLFLMLAWMNENVCRTLKQTVGNLFPLLAVKYWQATAVEINKCSRKNKEPRRNSEIYQQDSLKSAEISSIFENCLIFPWTPFIQGFSLMETFNFPIIILWWCKSYVA